MVLFKAGEDQLGRSCEKLRNMAKNQGEESVLHTIKRREATGLVTAGTAF